jgi:hypothetical protein
MTATYQQRLRYVPEAEEARAPRNALTTAPVLRADPPLKQSGRGTSVADPVSGYSAAVPTGTVALAGSLAGTMMRYSIGPTGPAAAGLLPRAF